MSRKQRLRVCLNLMQMFETTRSYSARQMYRKQYRRLASRLEKEKQLHAV
ncbi:hypothetical protein M5X17_05050 [Paenibacillus alvei]|nr:hypothetical protein [Paenibacillus alvei]MCY9733127.1 hypothetical protein [Paenibacillus alvei]